MSAQLSLESIYEYYRRLVRNNLPQTGNVLKCDTFNEGEAGYTNLVNCGLTLDRTSYLELSAETIARAKGKREALRVARGNVRCLPFADRSFAAVIDLSTIDHVPPGSVPTVIKEYERVLLPSGVLILVTWCSDKPNHPPVWGSPVQQKLFLSESQVLHLLDEGSWGYEHTQFHRVGDVYLLSVLARRSPLRTLATQASCEYCGSSKLILVFVDEDSPWGEYRCARCGEYTVAVRRKAAANVAKGDTHDLTHKP